MFDRIKSSVESSDVESSGASLLPVLESLHSAVAPIRLAALQVLCRIFEVGSNFHGNVLKNAKFYITYTIEIKILHCMTIFCDIFSEMIIYFPIAN